MKKIMSRWLYVFSVLFPAIILCQQSPVQPMMQIPSSPMASSLGKYAEYPVSLNTGTVNISVPLYTIRGKSLELPISLGYHSSGIRVNDEATSVGLGWSLNAGGVINREVNGKPDYGYPRQVAQADTLEYFGNPYKLLNDPEWDYSGPDPYRRAHIFSFKIDLQFLDGNELARKQYLDDLVRFKTSDAEPDRFSYNFNGRSGFFMFDNTGGIITSNRSPIKIDASSGALLSGSNAIEITTEDGTLYRFGKDVNGNAAYEETHTNGNPTPNPTSFLNIDYVSSWYLTEIVSADKTDTISLKYASYLESKTFYSQQISKTDDKEELDEYVPVNPVDCTGIVNNQVTITRETQYIDEIYFKNGKVKFNHFQDRQDTGGQYRLANLEVFRLENGIYTLDKKIKLDNGHYFQRDDSGLGGNYTASELKSLKLDGVVQEDGNGAVLGKYVFTYNGTDLPPRNCSAQDYWGYYNGEKQNTSLIPQATYEQTPDCFGQTSQVNRDANASYMKASVLEGIQYPTGGKVMFEYEPHYIKGTTTQEDVTTYVEEAIAYGQNPTLPGITYTPYQETQFIYSGGFTNTRINYEISGYSRNIGYTGNNYIKLIDVTDNDAVVFQVWHSGPDEPGGANDTKSGGTNISLVDGHTYKIQAYVGDSYLKPGGMSIFGTSYANVNVRWDEVTSTQNIVSKPMGGLRTKSIKYFADATQATPSFMKRYDYGAESYQGHGVGRQLFDHTNNLTRSISLNENFYDYSNYHSEPVDILTNNGSAVEYDLVTEYYSGADEFKTVYSYFPSNAMFSGLPIRNSPYPNTPRLYYPSWEQGILYAKKVYAFDSVSYSLVSEDYHTYVDLGTENINALKAQVFSRNDSEATLGIVAFNYDIFLGKKALSTTTSNTYGTDGNLIVSKVSQFGYEPEFFLQESITNNGSKNDETIKNIYTYPHNIVGASSVETDLENAHRLMPPLETATYKVVGTSEELLAKQKTVYKDWGLNGAGTANIISPEKIQSLKGGGPSSQFTDDIVFISYDSHGNPTESSRPDGSHAYYIWGYNSSLLIAKIDNLEASEVTTSLQSLIDSAVAASNADSDRTFGPSGSEGALRTALDNIRDNSALSGAMMTSYTYDSLIGITSTTDAKGYTMYYEYDNFNRLKLLKDDSGNIVKDYQYHYYDQNN